MSSRLLLLSARCALALAGFLPSVVAASAAEPWTVGDYQVISSVRVGRTDVEFEIRASITNGGANATGVTAKVTSTVASTVILDDSLSFGDVAAGVKQPAQDTFKIRQNRTSSFDASRLVWEVTVAPVGSLQVTITAPADGFLANTPVVHVTGNTSAAVASVKVNAVTASLSGTSFAADVPVIEGGNTLTAVATDSAGTVATASVNVTRDTQSPRVAIDSPASGSVVGTNQITVTGIINDTVIGTVNSTQASVRVNGITATVANRTFSAANVPLSPGANTLIANAVDRAGNVGTASVSVTFLDTASPKVQIISGDNQTARIGTLLPTPLGVLVSDAQGAPMAGEEVIFKVIQNDGLLTGGGRTARSVIIPTDSSGQAQVAFQIGTRVGVGNHQVEAMVVGISIDALFRASATPAPPALLVADAGNRQSGVPGQPLARPLVAIVVDSGNNRLAGVPITFTATEGGGSFAGSAIKTVLTDADGRALATLTLGAEEGIENNRVEATFSGNTQLPVAFVASGLTPGPAAETSISGVILDNSDVPVPGATLTINGTTLSARSDAQGQFSIKPAPVGTVRLDVDGSTVTRAGSWVNLDFTLTTVSGKDNTIGMPIRLLPMDLTHAVPVGTNYGGTITLPDFPGFSLKLLPDSVTFPGGSHVGSVHATVVHNDKTPEVPNFGQQPRFIVSINPKRAAFNPPAQMCLPNLDGLPPGQKTEMYSFDEDLDSFVSIGTGTVSADGMQICSDSGFGVIKGGWHCGGNPGPGGGAQNVTVSVAPKTVVLTIDGSNMSSKTVTASGNPGPAGTPAYTWSGGTGIVGINPTQSQSGTTTLSALAAGRATVTVTYRCKSGQSASDTVDVSVVSIETETVVTAPADRKRRKVGIGEKVNVTLAPSSLPSVTWTVSGGGTVAPASGTATVFTAGETASTSTVTATLTGGETITVTFTVVEPAGVTMEQQAGSLTTQTNPLGLQYFTNVFVNPADVNFTNVSVSEGAVAAVTTGYFTYQQGLVHPATGSTVPLSTFVAGKGTQMTGRDTIGGGTQGAPYSAGTFTWSIPWFYHIGATMKQFTTLDHVKSLTMAGGKATLTITKAGASGSVTEP